MKKLLAVLALCVVPVVAQAAIVFQDLKTGPPPFGVGQYAVAPFNVALEAAIVDGTVVTTIPGSPVPGNLTVAPGATKHTVPGGGWATWSHGYTGPVFEVPAGSGTLTLPANVGAFYFYAEPNSFSIQSIQATTDTGVTSGPIPVVGNAGANGFAFYTTAGESIATITVTTSDSSFAIGEFGAAAPAPLPVLPTLSPLAMAALGIGLALLGVILLRGRLG